MSKMTDTNAINELNMTELSESLVEVQPYERKIKFCIVQMNDDIPADDNFYITKNYFIKKDILVNTAVFISGIIIMSLLKR